MLKTKLVFPIDNAIKASYDTPENADLFDGDNLIVSVSHTEYKPVYEGTEIEYLDGFSNTVANYSKRRYGFEVEKQDGRIALFYMLSLLRESKKPVSGIMPQTTVLDYAFPEPSDYSTGYTTREGILVMLELTGGNIKTDNRLIGQGFRFRFMESTRRLSY